MDDSFLSMFLFSLLMLELIAAPAVACLDTDQTISWAKFMFLAVFSYAVFINLSSSYVYSESLKVTCFLSSLFSGHKNSPSGPFSLFLVPDSTRGFSTFVFPLTVLSLLCQAFCICPASYPTSSPPPAVANSCFSTHQPTWEHSHSSFLCIDLSWEKLLLLNSFLSLIVLLWPILHVR